MTPDQTSHLIRTQAMVFDGLRFNSDAIAIWHSDIGHLPAAAAEAAFAHYRRDPDRGGRTPRPADILAAHRGQLPDERRKPKPAEVTGCGGCDHGWTDTEDARPWGTYIAVAPCPRCRPATHERLLAGEYAPDWQR